MKIYQWSKIYTRYDKSINCEQQTHIFFPGNCYGRKISHSIKTDVRICEAWIHTRHLNEEQKGVDFHKKNIAGIHHKISWLFPDFPPFKDFPWLFTEFPDFSLTLKIKFFPDFSLTAGNPEEGICEQWCNLMFNGEQYRLQFQNPTFFKCK